MPIKNNSPLRAYIKKAHVAGIDRDTAWLVWKRVLTPYATESLFKAEWRDCEKGHKHYDFDPPNMLFLSLGRDNDED